MQNGKTLLIFALLYFLYIEAGAHSPADVHVRGSEIFLEKMGALD